MTTSDELEQWNLRSFENLMGATENANESLKKLGDTLNHSTVDLSAWGGEAADAWRALHGRVRVDIDGQGRQAEAVFNKLTQIYPEFRSVKTDYEQLKSDLARNRFTIAPPGTVVGEIPTSGGSAALQYITAMQQGQSKLDTILARATNVSAEMAEAMYAACGTAAPQHTPAPPPKPADTPKPDGTTPADQLPLPAQGNQIPFPTESTRDNTSPDVSHHLADNAAPSPLLAGLSADEWRQRLSTFTPGDPLPDPRTPTGDKAIDALAHAAGQQNTTYAWGGNKSASGPSPGQGDNGDGANRWHDWDRVGYDCGGLVRYSVQQGAGFDVGQGTNAIDTNSHFSRPGGGIPSSAVVAEKAQPGDVLVFGGSGAYQGSGTAHTGIYIGNGFMINAPQSGEPVQVDKIAGHGTTDILRLP
ncbi:MAG: C40 family peptidase [Actinomycetia bacterium]|nr:C40 family peptidase [Actinomycetes bacterium]